MGIKEIYQKFIRKFDKKPVSKIGELHQKIVLCNQNEYPHHIYLANDFLLLEIQHLSLPDIELLDANYINWNIEEKLVLKDLISQYSKVINNLKAWLAILYKGNFYGS